MPPADDDQTLAAPARRRRDGEPSGPRALLWGARRNDIELLPHSPLAIADVLSSEEGHFDLLPLSEEVDAPPPSAGAQVQAISAGRPSRRQARCRTNLLTRHDRASLRERCRGAIVESALVRRRDERRLYLAAGFLRGDGLEAPLLLYPALLICKADDSGHELRMLDTRAEPNRCALLHCRERFGIDLPEPVTGQALDDYLGLVAASVAPLADLEFVFDIAIGNSDASFLARPPNPAGLPDVPERFDAQLAMSLARDVSLEELHAILQLMPQPGVDGDESGQHLAGGSDDPLARLRQLSVKLAARGLEHCDFATLGQLPTEIDRWLADIRAAHVCPTARTHLAEHRLSVAQLARLGGIMELIDKAPAGVDEARHADLAFESTAQLLTRARHQAQLIEDEFAALQDDFLIDRIPPKAELLELMDLLAEAPARGLVDADYFNARRRFMEFSVDKPVQLDDAHRRQLGQVVKVMRFRELFVNNTEYRRALGAAYRGLRTDWTALATLVGYARELADVLGSEALAATALHDFAAFRQTLVNDLDVLRRSADALRAAVAVFGRRWQQREIGEAIEHLVETRDRLLSLQRRFGTFEGHGQHTPAAVLSQFTGESRHDANTERRVREARARIDRSLRSGQADAAVVADTLEWLRTASRRAAERQLDIAAIVDHLQIA